MLKIKRIQKLQEDNARCMAGCGMGAQPCCLPCARPSTDGAPAREMGCGLAARIHRAAIRRRAPEGSRCMTPAQLYPPRTANHRESRRWARASGSGLRWILCRAWISAHGLPWWRSVLVLLATITVGAELYTTGCCGCTATAYCSTAATNPAA